MSAQPSKLARWLPTLLGIGASLTVAALYELGVFGSTPSPVADDEPCCVRTREPAPPPALPEHRHRDEPVEPSQTREPVEPSQTREPVEPAEPAEVRFTHLSQAELEAMAANCDVRTDYPVRLGPEDFEDLDLAPAEQAAYDRALVEFAEQETELYRELYGEVAGPDVDVDALSATELRTALVRSLGRGKQPADRDIRKTIAEERAGLRAPPSDPDDGSIYARYTRARFAAGDRFAALLERELGEARADELRTAFDGWKGVRLREFECPRSAP